jgi:multidrug resistance efflux pump
VRGRVVDVPVAPNTPLKKGDVLFRIDPTVYEQAVKEQEAALAAAIQNVEISGQDLNRAKAQVTSAQASFNNAKATYERYTTANKNARSSAPFSLAQVANRESLFLTAEANLNAAVAAEQRARLSYESQINGENTEVARVKAKLEIARFDLRQTVVTAPTDGMVIQLILRPGVIAVPLPLKPVMVFVHAEKPRLVASFLQNYAQRLQPGHEAEIIFSAIPGRVFYGEIETVLPVLSQGAVQASGNLISANKPIYERTPVAISIHDDLSDYNLPAGSVAEVAVYTEHVQHVAMIRRILLRMKSWQNYIFGEGH